MMQRAFLTLLTEAWVPRRACIIRSAQVTKMPYLHWKSDKSILELIEKMKGLYCGNNRS